MFPAGRPGWLVRGSSSETTVVSRWRRGVHGEVQEAIDALAVVIECGTGASPAPAMNGTAVPSRAASCPGKDRSLSATGHDRSRISGQNREFPTTTLLHRNNLTLTFGGAPRPYGLIFSAVHEVGDEIIATPRFFCKGLERRTPAACVLGDFDAHSRSARG